ncbi:uncharacterized protein LOC142578495 [Dermacentor variabilis]|uniref:uncharacterized protein LOC142578495 n=1 Tax=Dermacentor variabilis TaxID=34621 RepID=UPI003F5B316A
MLSQRWTLGKKSSLMRPHWHDCSETQKLRLKMCTGPPEGSFQPRRVREHKSLFGRHSKAHKDVPEKEALDPRRENAILSYTARHFDTAEIKNMSLMLAHRF